MAKIHNIDQIVSVEIVKEKKCYLYEWKRKIHFFREEGFYYFAGFKGKIDDESLNNYNVKGKELYYKPRIVIEFSNDTVTSIVRDNLTDVKEEYNKLRYMLGSKFKELT